GALPTRVDFGRLGIDQSNTQTVKVLNTDKSVRTVTAIAVDNSSFALGNIPLPFKINPGASVDVPFVFKPRNLSIQVARAFILSDDKSPSPLTITLSGIGLNLTPPEVTVRSPMGGEHLHPGDHVNIDWEVKGRVAVAKQEILFSMDDGNSFTIAVATGL